MFSRKGSRPNGKSKWSVQIMKVVKNNLFLFCVGFVHFLLHVLLLTFPVHIDLILILLGVAYKIEKTTILKLLIIISISMYPFEIDDCGGTTYPRMIILYWYFRDIIYLIKNSGKPIGTVMYYIIGWYYHTILFGLVIYFGYKGYKRYFVKNEK